MRTVAVVVAALLCACDASGDATNATNSLRGSGEKRNRTLQVEAALGCNPDPHCHREGDQCKCCFNGGCDYEDMCKCGGAINSYSEGLDARADKNSTAPNSTGMMDTLANFWCASVGDKCGGPWTWPKKCCGNAKCQKLRGGDGTMKCVEEHPVQQCVPLHGECGGPGRRTETCCHGTCQSEFGGGVMKCVKYNPAHGCWSSNGAICQYVFGQASGCHPTARACHRATGKPPGCYEYNGAKCVWVVGDDPSKCYESKKQCEHKHRRLGGASVEQNRTLESEASPVTCSPDPHCSWERYGGCRCCYEGRGCVTGGLRAPDCKCSGSDMNAHEDSSVNRLREGSDADAHEDSSVISLSEGAGAGARDDSAELNATGAMVAFASSWCAPVGGVCNGWLPWQKKCCGSAKCQKLLGGDGTMKCVEEHPVQQCVPLQGECGGPGRRTETCCHGTCESQLGGGVMKCVDKQCVAPHAECGGPGRQTLRCCSPEFSCKAPFGSAVMKCM